MLSKSEHVLASQPTDTDALCDDWAVMGMDLATFINNARNEAVRALRVAYSGGHVAAAANEIIAIRTQQASAASSQVTP